MSEQKRKFYRKLQLFYSFPAYNTFDIRRGNIGTEQILQIFFIVFSKLLENKFILKKKH